MLAFPFDFVWVFAAKVDDGGDAEFLELFEAFGAKLGSAKKRVVDFSGVWDAGKLEFFAERDGRDGGRRIILRQRKRRKDEEQTEEKKRARRKKFHRRLDAKSLARETGRKNLKTRR